MKSSVFTMQLMKHNYNDQNIIPFNLSFGTVFSVLWEFYGKRPKIFSVYLPAFAMYAYHIRPRSTHLSWCSIHSIPSSSTLSYSPSRGRSPSNRWRSKSPYKYDDKTMLASEQFCNHDKKINWDNFFCRYCSCFCRRQCWCRLKCAVIHLFNFRDVVSRAFEFWHYQTRSHFHIVNRTINTSKTEFNQNAIHFSTFPKWLQQSESHNKWMTLEKIFTAKKKFTHGDIKRLISSPKKTRVFALTSQQLSSDINIVESTCVKIRQRKLFLYYFSHSAHVRPNLPAFV